MIINIPLQVDEQQMEEVIQRDYEAKILDRIMEYVKTCLMNYSRSWYATYRGKEDKIEDGMKVLIEGQIQHFLDEHRQEIIDEASKILADKLARSKKGKAILEGSGEQE